MNLTLELNNYLEHLFFYSTIIIITYILLKLFYFKTKANFRYRAWIIILFLTILPFNINIYLNNDNNIISYKETFINNFEENTSVINKIESFNLLQYVFYFYLLSILILLIYQLYRYYTFNKLINRWSSKIEEPTIINKFNKVIKELKLEKRNIKLVKVEGITTPLSTRIFKPIIVLPQHITNDEQLYYILKHEAIHLKRYDIIIKYFALLVQTLFWFNPLIFLLVRKIDIECETSCDDLVVAHKDMQQKKSYLEKIINTINSDSSYLYSSQFLGNNKDLINRFESLLNPVKKNYAFMIIIVTIIFSSSSFLAIDAQETKQEIIVKDNNSKIKQKQTDKKINQQKNMMSLEETKTIALNYTNGGYIDEVEYEVESGIPTYEFEIEKNNYEYSFNVSLIDGTISNYEQEYDD